MEHFLFIKLAQNNSASNWFADFSNWITFGNQPSAKHWELAHIDAAKYFKEGTLEFETHKKNQAYNFSKNNYHAYDYMAPKTTNSTTDNTSNTPDTQEETLEKLRLKKLGPELKALEDYDEEVAKNRSKVSPQTLKIEGALEERAKQRDKERKPPNPTQDILDVWRVPENAQAERELGGTPIIKMTYSEAMREALKNYDRDRDLNASIKGSSPKFRWSNTPSIDLWRVPSNKSTDWETKDIPTIWEGKK